MLFLIINHKLNKTILMLELINVWQQINKKFKICKQISLSL